MPTSDQNMLRVDNAAALRPQPCNPQEWLPKLVRRRTLFDLSPMLHCSVIGTCLTVAELRKIVRKILGDHVEKFSDHDLHTQGVRLASVKGLPSKLLNKALDEKHQIAVRRFGKADTENDVRSLWNEARREGQVESAYWAAVTHPLTSESCLQQVFGDLHMLSHLVGASNRADIRRLLEFETEIATLRACIEETKAAMRAGFSRRDIEIQQLRRALLASVRERTDDVGCSEEASALRSSLAQLQQQLDAAATRVERQQASVREGKLRERSLQTKLEAAEVLGRQLEKDLQSLENCIHAAPGADGGKRSLGSKTVLYVGGKSGSIQKLRALVEMLDGKFLHHDGGQTQNIDLLAGLIRRADCVFFPVDFVSHQAMYAVKRHCALNQIAFIALHRSGAGSLTRGIEQFLSGGEMVEPPP